MSPLEEKYYGLHGESPAEIDRRNDQSRFGNKKFGVQFTVCKYFLSAAAAKSFFSKMEKGAALVKKNKKTGEVLVLDEK